MLLTAPSLPMRPYAVRNVAYLHLSRSILCHCSIRASTKPGVNFRSCLASFAQLKALRSAADDRRQSRNFPLPLAAIIGGTPLITCGPWCRLAPKECHVEQAAHLRRFPGLRRIPSVCCSCDARSLRSDAKRPLPVVARGWRRWLGLAGRWRWVGDVGAGELFIARPGGRLPAGVPPAIGMLRSASALARGSDDR